MGRLMLVALIGLFTAACPDRDTRAGEPQVDPVDVDTLAWFGEGRTVEHAGYRWVIVGPPVYEPLALHQVGDFEGTPLYAERGVASPPRRVYIPVGGGYWQMLERVEGLSPADPAEAMDGDVQPGTEGVEP
jgi:hypothetical protein